MRVTACLLAVVGVFAGASRAPASFLFRPVADGHPTWSPDDGAVAYVSTEGPPAIFRLADRSTTDVAVPPKTSFVSFSPDWSLVASIRQGQQPALVVSRPDGTDARTFDDILGTPTWAPNGERLAYMTREGESNAVYTIRVDGTDRHRVVVAAGGTAFAWSPDSSQLAFAQSGDLVLVRFDGGDVRRLTVPDGRVWAVPSWSPDGRRLAVLVGDSLHPTIGIVSLAGAPALSIEPATPIGLETRVSWSPDGSRVLYSEGSMTNKGYGAYEVELATGTQQQVALFGGDASYSHDGAKIVFGGLTSVKDPPPVPMCVGVGIWVVPQSGGRPARVTGRCNNPPYTISISAPRELTYGERGRLTGTFLPGFGEVVHGTARPCGRRSTTFLELADELWSRSIAPTVTTVYTAASDVEQTSVTTVVRPSVVLRQTGRRTFEVKVSADRSLAGKAVIVERFDSTGQGRWVRVGRFKLKNFVARFPLASAPLGITRFVRAILPKNQVGPCYAAGTSNELMVGR